MLEGGLVLGPSSLLSLMSNLDLFGDCLGEPDDEALLLVLLVRPGPSICASILLQACVNIANGLTLESVS